MPPALPDPRSIRIAENESRFRAVNERLEQDLRAFAEPGEELEFVCECGRQSCHATIRLTLAQYEHTRGDSRTFALVPGHEAPDVEDVVEDHGGFMVVRKHEGTAAIVERGDAREGA